VSRTSHAKSVLLRAMLGPITPMLTCGTIAMHKRQVPVAARPVAPALPCSMLWQRQAGWLVVVVVTFVLLDTLDVPDPWPFVVILGLIAAYGADTLRVFRRGDG
jgi:hypothetical protein